MFFFEIQTVLVPAYCVLQDNLSTGGTRLFQRSHDNWDNWYGSIVVSHWRNHHRNRRCRLGQSGGGRPQWKLGKTPFAQIARYYRRWRRKFNDMYPYEKLFIRDGKNHSSSGPETKILHHSSLSFFLSSHHPILLWYIEIIFYKANFKLFILYMCQSYTIFPVTHETSFPVTSHKFPSYTRNLSKIGSRYHIQNHGFRCDVNRSRQMLECDRDSFAKC